MSWMSRKDPVSTLELLCLREEKARLGYGLDVRLRLNPRGRPGNPEWGVGWWSVERDVWVGAG